MLVSQVSKAPSETVGGELGDLDPVGLLDLIGLLVDGQLEKNPQIGAVTPPTQ
jgi:hypothetical protein